MSSEERLRPTVTSTTLFRYRVDPRGIEYNGLQYELAAVEVEIGPDGTEVWGDARRLMENGRKVWRSLQLPDYLARPYREDAEARYRQGAR